MRSQSDLPSRILELVFTISVLVSIALTWHTMIAQKKFAVFTNPDEVPETTDFFIESIKILKNAIL